MKKAKRWLALILAVTLVSSNALYQIGTTLSADETQNTEQTTEETPEEETQELDVEDTKAAEVSEVTAESATETVLSSETTETPAAETAPSPETGNTSETETTETPAAETTPSPETANTSATETTETPAAETTPSPETTVDTSTAETTPTTEEQKTETTATDAATPSTETITTDLTKTEAPADSTSEVTNPADVNLANQDAAPEENKAEEETSYEIKIKVDDPEAGTIYAENADGDKEELTLEDGQYTTTVKEGEDFSFELVVEDGYILTEVQDQDGNTVAPAESDTENHTYNYELKDIQADQTLEIAYTEAEVTYPAFSYSGTEDGVTANISAPEGVFPEGTEVELKAISAEDRAAIAEAGGCEPEEVVGLDITFTYEGTVIEPTGNVEVTFQADQLADEKYDKVKVFHVEKSGNVNEVEATTEGDSVGFTTDSFSPVAATPDTITPASEEGTKSTYEATIVYLDNLDQEVGTRESANVQNGKISDNAPEKGGYAFVYATLGQQSGTKIEYAAYEDGNTYYSADEDALVLSQCDSDESITLYYRQSNNRINLTAKKTGDGASVAGNEIKDFPTYAEAGSSVNFAVELARGYECTVTKSDGTAITPSNNVYTLESVSDENNTVTVSFNKLETVTFDPTIWGTTDNTDKGRFSYNTDTKNELQTGNVGTNGAKFSFSFTTNGNSGRTWWLDSLAINNKALSLPSRTVNESASTVLYEDKQGQCVAKVTVDSISIVGNNKSIKYTLSITGARENLKITNANLNNVTWPESIARMTDGIDYTAIKGNKIDLPTALEDSPAYKFTLKRGYKDLTLKITAYNSNGNSVTLNYTPNASSDITAKVKSKSQGGGHGGGQGGGPSGGQGGSSSFQSVKVGSITENEDGSSFTVDLKKNDSSGITLMYVEASATKCGYTVSYDVNGGTGTVTDTKTYSITDSVVVISNQAPTKTGYYFIGWKIKDDTSDTIYTAGDAIDILSEENPLVSANKDGEITFVAQYVTEINEGTALGIPIRVFKQQINNGKLGYVEDTDAIRHTKGVAGKSITLNQSAILTYEGYTYNAEMSTVNISAVGFGSEIKLYYDLPHYTVTATAPSSTLEYDGTGKFAREITYADLPDGYTISGLSVIYRQSDDTVNSPIDAGEYTTVVTGTPTIWDKTGKDVTAQFSVNFQPGTLTITRRVIEITAGSASKTYDGTALTENSYRVTSGGKAATDEITSVTVTGSITDVGEEPNKASKAVIKRDEVVATGNYDITYKDGTLKITKQTIDPGTDPENPDPEYAGVTVNDPTNHVYNKTEHKFVPEVKTKDETVLTEGTDYSVVYKRDGEVTEDFTNVGKITVVITGKGNYKGEVTKTYKITPATVKVTAKNKAKTYGENDPEFTAEVTGLYEGDPDIVYTFVREKAGEADGEKVGTYDITPTGEESQGNYTVQYKSGTLTISASNELTVSGTDYEGTYDAKAHGSAATASITEGTTISYKVGDGEWTTEFPTITDVGTVQVTVKAENSNYTTAEAEYTLKVNPKPVTVKAEAKSKVYGAEDPELTATVEGTLNEDTVAYTLSREEGEDVNQYVITATGDSMQGNYTVSYTSSTLTITKRPLVINTKSASKTYDETPLTADGTITGLANGETVTFQTTGKITYVGSVKNSYKLEWNKTAKECNYTVSENVGTLTITDGTDEDLIDSRVVWKNHNEKPDKSQFTVGDVITFNISAENIYNENKTIIFEEQAGVTITGNAIFENVAPGKIVKTTATYTIQESDLVADKFINTVKAKFDGKTFTATDTIDNLVEPHAHVKITKEAENKTYKLNDQIVYTITVKNDGNMTLQNVKISDPLTADEFTIEGTFAPGARMTFETTPYTVTANDIAVGKVINNATLADGASTVVPNGPTPEGEDGEKEVPTEQQKPSLSVIKEVSYNGSKIGVGTELHYTITVTNNGNVEIKDIRLNDDLLDKSWSIGTLNPGKSDTKTATYTVTEKDVVAGRVVNNATATGKDPEGKDVTGTGRKTVETEDAASHITIKKTTTSTPANGTAYVVGEKITYQIVATNNGNLTLKNVVVTDKLTGDEWTIDALAPNKAETFAAEYTVKESDLGKTVVNEATAKGKTEVPDGPDPTVDPGRTEDETEDRKPSLSMTKEIVDKKDVYAIGDTVKYLITVTNTGNLTQSDVVITDQIKASGDAVITGVSTESAKIEGNIVTLASLAPNETVTVNVAYTVQKADRGNVITNGATAQGTVPGTDDPKKPEKPDPTVTPDVPADVENVYDIHVVHQFAPGNEGDVTLPADYTIENVKANTFRLIEAEQLTGYVAQPTGQTVTVVDQDVTLTILYYKDSIGTDPINPDKPDGIPDEYQVVVRFEAVNGTVSIDHTVVTLYDANGNPAANGVGHMSPFRIAAARANDGYDQASLSWTPGVPTPEYDITEAMTFRAVFTAATTPTPENPDNTNPTNPDNSNPSNGGGTSGGGTDDTTPAGDTTPQAAPAANTPAVVNATPAAVNPVTNFINNVVNPVVDTVKDRVADIQEILNSDDDQVPLTDQKLDDHKCCILHFLIMLLALLISIFETRSMKKRQKKLQEVREELDCELARRGLPVTGEQQ